MAVIFVMSYIFCLILIILAVVGSLYLTGSVC